MSRLCCVLWLGLVCAMPSLAAADDYIRIGSWNIENLGDRRCGQHPKALVEHLLLANVDVLALQEIHDTDRDAETYTNYKLDGAFRELNEIEGHDWEYELFPGRDRQETARLTGVAWNKARVKKLGESFRIPVDYAHEETWKRTPYAAKFTRGEGMSDLVVISIHMKSNRPIPGIETEVLRQKEAEALVAKLPLVKEKFDAEQDIVIVGDTNCLSDDEPALKAYKLAGFKDLNKMDRQTYAIRSAPFDRFLIPDQDEFRYTQQYILNPANEEAHDGNLSDHFLILAAVKLLPDDDKASVPAEAEATASGEVSEEAAAAAGE